MNLLISSYSFGQEINDYQWQRSTNNGVSFSNIAGANSSSYTENSVTSAMSGHRYRVEVRSNNCTNALSSAAILTVNTSIGIFEEYITGEGLAGEYRIKSWQELNVILPIDDTIEHQLKIFNPHDHALEILEASVTSDQLGLTAPELKNAPSWTIEPGDTKHVVTV